MHLFVFAILTSPFVVLFTILFFTVHVVNIRQNKTL
nr:MAG TPA: hypothetical protein [Bacteriophage sp.]